MHLTRLQKSRHGSPTNSGSPRPMVNRDSKFKIFPSKFKPTIQLTFFDNQSLDNIYISRLTVVSREAKEEVPFDGLSTNAREYFTRTNLAKTKNTITYEP